MSARQEIEETPYRYAAGFDDDLDLLANCFTEDAGQWLIARRRPRSDG